MASKTTAKKPPSFWWPPPEWHSRGTRVIREYKAVFSGHECHECHECELQSLLKRPFGVSASICGQESICGKSLTTHFRAASTRK